MTRKKLDIKNKTQMICRSHCVVLQRGIYKLIGRQKEKKMGPSEYYQQVNSQYLTYYCELVNW